MKNRSTNNYLAEIMETAAYLGGTAYGQGIDAPIKDAKLMGLMPGEDNDISRAMLRAWWRGYRKIQRESGEQM